MAFSDPDNAVHLKNTQAWGRQFAAMAGFGCLVMVPISASIIAQGDWGGLLLLAIPAAILAVGKWADRIEPEDHAVLYPDRMEFPGHGTHKTVFYWSEVTGIRWPTLREEDPDVMIKVPREEEKVLPWIRVGLRHVSPADRLKLIRHLREKGAQVEQERWPRFCHRCAVPLVEALQRLEGAAASGGEPDTPDSSLGALSQGPWRLVKRHPFLAGLLSPLFLVWMVSRSTWWTLSALVALSALVNIRLIWGRWVSPFTEACLGFAGVLFLFGLVTPKNFALLRGRACPPRVAVCSLGVLLFGLPLMVNALALGWIPGQLGKWLGYLGLFLVALPIIIEIQKQKRRERQRAPELEADALRRWAVYESTGRLPESELPWQREN